MFDHTTRLKIVVSSVNTMEDTDDGFVTDPSRTDGKRFTVAEVFRCSLCNAASQPATEYASAGD